jgi:dihydropteroate synthase
MKNFSTTGTLFSKNLSLNLRGRIHHLSEPLVMGIINTTHDSFFQGSRHPDPGKAVEMARSMLETGAGILDIGAVSTRPGAEEIPEEEELNRLIPVVSALREQIPEALISIDTCRASVASKMHEQFRVEMINDISGGMMDREMFSVIGKLRVPYVVMHMQGTPMNMQDAPAYKNVVDDLLQFFGERVYRLRKLGVNDIIIDPGFGFGKTLEQNYQLLLQLETFQMLELPIMVGISRKSMIYKVLETDPGEALNGTTAAHMAALLKGASILRVHDVKAAAETVKIFKEIVKSRSNGV